MAWITQAIPFEEAFTFDAEKNTITGVANDAVCLQDYRTTKKTVVSAVGSTIITTIYTTVDATYSIVGMSEAAAKATADSFAQHNGFFAEARKVYASDGWEVSVTQHTTTSQSTQTPVSAS